jgi:outer membrane protein assembly factor BamB
MAIELESLPGGIVVARLTEPVVHVERMTVAKAAPQIQGGDIRIGLFTFRYDRATDTLTGVMPEALVPVYTIPFTLRRVENVDDLLAASRNARAEPAVPLVNPAWTFDAGAPCWPGPTFSNGIVFAGCDDGQLHALDARTGRRRWSFRAGGPIRTRATVSGDALYFQADDGVLYKVAVTDGAERWRVRVVETPVVRLPLDNPKSRFDRFGSDVAAAGDRLYLGTHDGRIVAIDAADGSKPWEFRTGATVAAAPAVAGGRVYAGSFDKHVYALDRATGALVWKRDTQGAIVSTPALEGNRLVVGNRIYDLLGLDADNGDVAWRRYVWFSWVESSATIRDGTAYVGSSDAAALFAFEARTGRMVWKTDVQGWAWGQPAVSNDRVYVGTASQPGYLGGVHHGGAMALDRRTGRPVWRFAAEPGKSGPYGFPGSPATGGALTYFSGLDGKVYAFAR